MKSLYHRAVSLFHCWHSCLFSSKGWQKLPCIREIPLCKKLDRYLLTAMIQDLEGLWSLWLRKSRGESMTQPQVEENFPGGCFSAKFKSSNLCRGEAQGNSTPLWLFGPWWRLLGVHSSPYVGNILLVIQASLGIWAESTLKESQHLFQLDSQLRVEGILCSLDYIQESGWRPSHDSPQRGLSAQYMFSYSYRWVPSCLPTNGL